MKEELKMIALAEKRLLGFAFFSLQKMISKSKRIVSDERRSLIQLNSSFNFFE